MSDYAIGLTYAGMTDLESLAVPVPPPYSYPMRYTTRFECASAAYIEAGWLEQEWHWGFLTESQCETLRGYAGKSVYVKTRSNSGSFSVYQARFIWPEQEPEHFAGRVIDLTITLRNLIPYTP